MINRMKRIIVKFLIFSIVFSPFSFLEAKASDPTISLANNYEIAAAGTNLDSEVDQNGNTYVVYDRSSTIYLVKNRGSEQLVGSGTNPTIALDYSGSPHIAYISSGAVIYETFDGDWNNDVNVGIGTSASYVDMDVDSNGRAHLFFRARYYGDSYVDLVYASNTTGVFTVNKSWNGFFDDYGGASGHMEYYSSYPVSIKIDAANNYHLLYWFNNIDKAPGWIDRTYYIKYETNLAGNSIDKVGDFALYKNSLTVDALGRANVVYGATKHGLISSGTWTESAIAATKPSISSNNTAIGIGYIGAAGAYYYENDGSGPGETIQIDPSGDNPVTTMNNTNRFVYYTKAGKIYLATDKTLYNTPVITGVEEGGIYNTDKEVSWDHGDGVLNDVPVSSPLAVSVEGVYNLTVVNAENKSSSVNFSIDKTKPIITVNEYNTVPTNQDITVNASTNEGTLNAPSHTFSENGSFEFIATDAAGNQTSENIDITNIDKVAPTIEIEISSTSPTNQDITVTATVNEGTLNATSHTFTENGSFEFVATDAAGNIAKYNVTVSNIDKVSPIISIDPYSTSWTKEDITVTASTNEGALNAPSHTFTENGSFEFVATDPAGNQTTQTVTVNNIDKIKPSGTEVLSPANDSYVRQTVQFQAISIDEESGIEKVEFHSEKSGKLDEDTTAPFGISWDTTSVSDGEQDIWVSVYDKAGNKSDSRPTTVNVDNTPPVITLADYEKSPTNSNITVSASTNEGILNTTSNLFTENGSFEFVATDEAGNIARYTVTITNIDKEGPEISIGSYNTQPTNQDIIVNASVEEGTINATSHTFTENGSYTFVATDSLGNESSKVITISNIDKSLPEGSITSITVGGYYGGVYSLETELEDDGSGIDKVEFWHASVPTLIGTVFSAPFTIDWNTALLTDGEHEVWSVIYDFAGNKTITPDIKINIDNTAPVISIDEYSKAPTYGSVTVTASVNEGTLNASSHSFTKNGSFTFVATDSAGNSSTKTVTIDNIYQIQPVAASSPEAIMQTIATAAASTDEESTISTSDTAAPVSVKPTEGESVQTVGEDVKDESEQTEIKGESTQSATNKSWWWLTLIGLVAVASAVYVLRSRKSKEA